MKKFTCVNRKLFVSAFVSAALALTVTPALAQPGYGGASAGQEPAQQQAMPGQQPAAQNFDDGTLMKFASAAVALGEIQNDFTERLKGVQDQQKAMELQEKANEQMVEAVQESGLQVKTYNAIANQMSTDEELRQKMMGMIEQQK